ncbi:hypothetical protein Tco_1142201 [Tanacetum coccineum]
MVFNSPCLTDKKELIHHEVEMVINSPWIMPLFGTKGLASPEQTTTGISHSPMIQVSKSWTGFLIHVVSHRCPTKGLANPQLRLLGKGFINLLLFLDSPLPRVNTPWDVMRIVCNPKLMYLIVIVAEIARAVTSKEDMASQEILHIKTKSVKFDSTIIVSSKLTHRNEIFNYIGVTETLGKRVGNEGWNIAMADGPYIGQEQQKQLGLAGNKGVSCRLAYGLDYLEKELNYDSKYQEGMILRGYGLLVLPLLLGEIDAMRTVGEDELLSNVVDGSVESLKDDSLRRSMVLVVSKDGKVSRFQESNLMGTLLGMLNGMILSVGGGGGGVVSSTAMTSTNKRFDELESEKADFSNIYDLLLEECVSKDVTCSYLHSLSESNAHTELKCMYLHKVKECECLAQKLSKQTESVNNEVHNKLLKSFAKLEKHSISLELSLQHCKEQMKNNPVCKENGSNVFRKEREQYHEIQDLKAQMQDKNIAISELKKLIENCKGKSVETQFNKPSVVRKQYGLNDLLKTPSRF